VYTGFPSGETGCHKKIIVPGPENGCAFAQAQAALASLNQSNSQAPTALALALCFFISAAFSFVMGSGVTPRIMGLYGIGLLGMFCSQFEVSLPPIINEVAHFFASNAAQCHPTEMARLQGRRAESQKDDGDQLGGIAMAERITKICQRTNFALIS
jgi:hypothetical protein